MAARLKWGGVLFLALWLLLPRAQAEAGKPLYSVPGDNGKWGYIDCRGQWAIPPQFDYAEDFRGDWAVAYQFREPVNEEDWYANLDGTAGIIDSHGNWAVPPEYDILSQSDSGDFAGGRDAGIVFFTHWRETGSREGFFDLPSGCFSGLVFDEVCFDWADMDEDLICVEMDGKLGFASRKTGELTIPCRYAAGWVYRFSEGYAAVAYEEEGQDRWLLADAQGRETPLPEDYYVSDSGGLSEGLLIVGDRSTGRFGYVNADGEDVIPPRYERALPFHKGLAQARLPGGRNVVIDREGREVLTLPEDQYLSAFPGGFAYQDGTDIVFADGKGQELNRFNIPGLNGISYFNKNGIAFYEASWEPKTEEDEGWGVGLLSSQGEMLTPPVFYVPDQEWDAEFSEGLMAAVALDTMKMGYIDGTGAWALPPVYDGAANFRDGLAWVWDAENGQHRYSDREGNTLFSWREDQI